MKVLGDEKDPNGLLHKVKSVAQLKDLGAEPAGDSCILGDVGYEVQPGFLAEAAALQAAASAKPAPAPERAAAPADPAPAAPAGKGADLRSRPLGSGPLPKDLEEKRKEAEALARFLLDNLS
jgi:hypothetical protein